MKLYLNIMFLLFGLTLAKAQTNYTVKGKVVDFHNKNPLSDAQIWVGNAVTHSNSEGFFQINNIKPGKYVLKAQHPDCDLFSEEITVDKDIEISLLLEHHIHDIETVTLYGKSKSGTLAVKTLDKEIISRNSTENLGNLLSNMAGVGALKTGNNIAKPIIHGLYGSRVAILNNGVKMADQEWGSEHAPNVDINNFQQIEVIKGASALKYGSDAVGGAVVLLPETFKKIDTLKGSANLSAISNGKGIGFDLKLIKTWESGWALKTNGGFKKLGDLHTPNYNLMNTGMDFNSFALTLQNNSFLKGISLDYSTTNQQIGIYRGSDIGNLEDFYRALTSDVPIYQRDFFYSVENPKQDIQHHLVKLSGFKRFENWGKISADYSFQYNHRREFDVRRGELASVPSLDLELFTNQFNLNDLIERPKWNLESGLDLSYQYNYSTPETQARRLVPNYDKYSGGAYSVFKYKISPKVNIEAALRYDLTKYNVKKWYDSSEWESLYAQNFSKYYVKTEENRVFTNPQISYKNLSFSAAFEYKPSPVFDLKFNYAKIGRTPNIAELFADGLHHSAAIIEVGNMAIKNEDGHQFNLNIDSKIDVLDGLQISANPYLFLTKNFITEIPTGIQNTIRGVFPVWNYKQVDAKMFGIDLDANLKINKNFNYKGRFSYVNGQDLTNNQPLILMLPPNFSNSLEFSKPEWKNFYVKVENQTFLHQMRFPVYNPSVNIYENGVQVEKILDLSTPPPTYSLWNFQTGFEWNKHFTFGVNATNILNKNYKDYLNRMRFFSYEMGRNVILNVKYNF